jgi:hypothetical protein
MFHSPRINHLITVSHSNGKLEVVHAVTDFDLIQQPTRIIQMNRSIFEITIDSFEEGRIGRFGHYTTPLKT